jgi:hypothetical protein
MSLFNLNWRTRVTNLLPSFKRSTSLTDFITALLEGLNLKAQEWFAFDLDVRKRSKFNSQVIVLQAALNNVFGISLAPFILVETVASFGQSVFIYNSAEGFLPTYIYDQSESNTVYFYNSSEITTGWAFIVKIPIGIYTSELDRQVSAEVRTYKLAGISFSIETY